MSNYKDNNLDYLIESREIFKQEGRWLQLPATTGLLISVGDLHGDGRVLDYLLDRYFYGDDDTVMIFLGDYADREPSSFGGRKSYVLDTLLKLKVEQPHRVKLLTGNHDLSNRKSTCYYSDFWDTLSDREHTAYSDTLSQLPIVATTANGVALCHGALPPTTNLTKLDFSKKKWLDLVWADYLESSDEARFSFRPYRLKKDFQKSMTAFNSNLLIKGHRAHGPMIMFDNKMVTIQSNRHYEDLCGIHIVKIDLSKQINSAQDVEIIKIKNLKR